jgi:soluble lytic murein transglycosylase
LPGLLVPLALFAAVKEHPVSHTTPPPDLPVLVGTYRETSSPAAKAAVEAYAAGHVKELSGTLARFALGVAEYEQKDYDGAISNLLKASGKLPEIADYLAYYLAAARVENNDMTGVAELLVPVHRSKWPSLYTGKAWILEARALKPAEPGEAARLLREHYSALPQPEGDITLADCYQAAGKLAEAAEYYQRIYYSRISGDAAARAAAALLTLKDSLGVSYPHPLPRQALIRARLLMDARDYSGARKEYQVLADELTGADRDLARVGIGAADFLAGNTAVACPYLRGLELATSDADAERLFHLEECSRRLMDDDEMMAAVGKLEKQYPQSPWRLRALIGAGNRYLVANRPVDFIPLYKAAYEAFPAEPAAAQAHWRVTFQSYLENQKNAPDLLREHLQKYPSHATAAASLYFLARGAERSEQLRTAATFYTGIAKIFPNTYYGMLARQRLALREVKNAGTSTEAATFLASLSLPSAKPVPVTSTTATSVRVERSRILRNAGLSDLADGELRFGARTDGQPILLGMEMAVSADAPYLGLRAMKSMSGDYLNLPLANAPDKFWHFLFPIPYREDLVSSARLRDLDPYLMAGLIRQESEFNPQALSSAKAYGLTQVLPVTGREFAKRAGVAGFTNRTLFQPVANLKIGTTVFRSMLDRNSGSLEQTLAAYNAGPKRAAEWSTWSTYREPAEFVEAIPFTETRDYVQAVLRNADIYRRLYR